jgi:hypothetical protein
MAQNIVKISQEAKQKAQYYVGEYLKCKADFYYFCTTYIWLELPGGDQLFKPYQKQVDLIKLIQKDHYVITLKSRQIGISTVIQAYSAWLVSFYDNVVVGIISKDGKEATDFARAIRGMVEKLPEWMKPKGGESGRGFAKRTEQSFILTNGSKVYASPVAPNAPSKTLRGKAVTLLVIDEAAFVNYIEDAWTAMVPALSTNQKQARAANIPYGTIILSTPNKTVGVGKFFYKRYLNSLTGDDIFKPFTIHWKQIPELANDPYWYKNQCALFDNDPKKIAQELELKFLPTEGSFFESQTIEAVQNSVRAPIEKFKMFNGEIWVFRRSEQLKKYIMGIDSAPENGLDKSGITIYDYETLEQVWEYQAKCRIKDLVKIAKVGITNYPGIVIIESNSYGNQVIEELMESEYSWMVYREKRGEDNRIPGLSNNIKTRPLMIDALYSYVSQFPEIIRSERLALELAGLIQKKNGRVEADEDCHDDLALASALCFYVKKYDPQGIVIDTSSHSQSIADMVDTLDTNYKERPDDLNDFVMTDIKENISKIQETGGLIDVLSWYKKE